MMCVSDLSLGNHYCEIVSTNSRCDVSQSGSIIKSARSDDLNWLRLSGLPRDVRERENKNYYNDNPFTVWLCIHWFSRLVITILNMYSIFP